MRAAAFLLRHKYASLTQLFGLPKIGEVSFGLQAIQRATEPLHWLLGACPSLADYVGGRRPPERRQRAYVAYALPVGDIVRWQWGDTQSHSTTSDTGAWDSGVHTAPPPFSFPWTFTAPGTFPYHCAIHGATGGIGMSGTITVI